jgi:hypothetical protein
MADDKKDTKVAEVVAPERDYSYDPTVKRMNHPPTPQKVVDRPDAPPPPPAPPAQMVGESDDEYKKRAALPPAKDVPVK